MPWKCCFQVNCILWENTPVCFSINGPKLESFFVFCQSDFSYNHKNTWVIVFSYIPPLSLNWYITVTVAWQLFTNKTNVINNLTNETNIFNKKYFFYIGFFPQLNGMIQYKHYEQKSSTLVCSILFCAAAVNKMTFDDVSITYKVVIFYFFIYCLISFYFNIMLTC